MNHESLIIQLQTERDELRAKLGELEAENARLKALLIDIDCDNANKTPDGYCLGYHGKCKECPEFELFGEE